MAAGVKIEVVMPQLGVSVTEGTIIRWLKREGQEVRADEPLLEISNDKVDTEVPSPSDGILDRIVKLEGETVDVGTTIALIAPGGAAEPAEESAEIGAETEEAMAAAPTPPPAWPAAGESRAFVSPVVAKIAAEHGVDIEQVPGTGRGGRVSKQDILAFVDGRTPARAGAAPAGAPPAQASAPQAREQIEPMSHIRREIASHMRRSLDTAAHVTTVFEVDMSRVVSIRERLKREYLERYDVRLTYLPFIARATVEALRNWPWLNGEIRGESVVTRSYVNLGIAVALDGGKGLIVPVVRNAEGLNLLGLARQINDLSERARSKRLVPDDVQGGTFTITNPGGFGAVMGTPIINQPQAAILDVEALVKRPVVVTSEDGSDSIAVRPMMNLCLSFDHRLVDGAYAAQFMRELRDSLQSWGEERY
jgi:pyruvate dehydrogenase E2 component (dihydrolipoamide acetyltransferase)